VVSFLLHWQQLLAAVKRNIIETTIDPLNVMTGWTFEQLQDYMQYGPYDIKASIYLASPGNSNFKPIVTPASDIKEDANGKDVFLGWITDSTGRPKRIDLWKGIADISGRPVFAIDARAKNIKDLINWEGPSVPLGDPHPGMYDPQQPPDYPNWRMSVTKYQIGYRYDNTPNSELNINGKMVYTPVYNSGANAFTRDFLRKLGCYEQKVPEYELASVPANDATNWATNNIDQFFAWVYGGDANTREYDNNYIPGTPNAIHQPRKVLFFNTYENDDWPVGIKPLSPEYVNGIALGLKGRMEGHEEWYQFNPEAGANTWWNQYGWRMGHGYIGWTYSMWTGPNVKGMLEFKITGNCSY
jgi:hypothetical protein